MLILFYRSSALALCTHARQEMYLELYRLDRTAIESALALKPIMGACRALLATLKPALAAASKRLISYDNRNERARESTKGQ